MPEPSKDPIKSDDPKYAIGAEARNVAQIPFNAEVVTVEDQHADRAKTLKRVAKIPAGSTLKQSKPTTTRGW